MRESALLIAGIAFAGTACSQGTPEEPLAAESEEKIACALGGEQELDHVCTVERVRTGESLVLVVHHPDGGFRRFVVETDGTGISPADGATSGITSVEGDWLDMAVGDDRYRFPMTRTDNAQTP